jgi:hypothetical protein
MMRKLPVEWFRLISFDKAICIAATNKKKKLDHEESCFTIDNKNKSKYYYQHAFKGLFYHSLSYLFQSWLRVDKYVFYESY